MALNSEAYVRLCNKDPTDPMVLDAECFQLFIPVAALDAPTFDLQQLEDLFGAAFYLFGLIFIIFMIKKAIEQ